MPQTLMQLASMPGMVSYFAGKPLDTARPNIDANYDVAFYAGFDSRESYLLFVQSPQHKAAARKWKPRWEWIRFEDVIDETP